MSDGTPVPLAQAQALTTENAVEERRMDTFQAMVLHNGYRRAVECERIGQLALHETMTLGGTTNRLTLSHAGSGYRLWTFETWVEREEVQRLAHLLSGQNFDDYHADGCVDMAFVAECKRIFAAWEATVPERLEHDHINSDQHV